MRTLLCCIAGLGLAVFVYPGTLAAQFDDSDSDPTPRITPQDRERGLAHDRLRAQVEAAYQRRDLSKVIELCTQMIAVEPRSPYPFYQRASALIESGKAANSKKQVLDGIADARQGLLLGGKVYPYLYVPYLFGLTCLAELDGKPDNAALAIRVVSPVLDQPQVSSADRSQLLYQRALAYLVTKEFDKAAEDTTEAVSLNPDFLAAYFTQAQCYTAMGDIRRARESYNRLVELFPQSWIAFNNRGTFLQQQGDSAAAEKDFSRTMQLTPQTPLPYINRGYARTSQRKYAEAEGDFLAALQRDANQPLAHYWIGLNRLSLGKWKPAIQDFTNAIRVSPNYAEAYAARGHARFFGKEFAASAADFEKALELIPAATALLPWRFAAWSAAQQSDKAKAQLTKALAAQRDPKAWPVQICGFLQESLPGEKLLAAAESAEPGERQARVCDACFWIARQKTISGQTDEALADLQKCVQTAMSQSPTYQGAVSALAETAPGPKK